jgi:hypothetical protein
MISLCWRDRCPDVVIVDGFRKQDKVRGLAG